MGDFGRGAVPQTTACSCLHYLLNQIKNTIERIAYQMVYVLNVNGVPLMPTDRHGKERKIGGKTMTWDELNKKYPEARDEMSIDRKRDFLKDLYDAYEAVGFVNIFWTPFDLNDEDKSYVGKLFKVIGRCEEGKEWDLESLPAWKIEFEDGHKMAAYPEEIYLEDMIANGYKRDKTITHTAKF